MTNKKNASPAGFSGLVLPLFLVIILFLAAFQKQRWDTDIFWALKSGQWIFDNFKVPSVDSFSYTFGGKEWIDFTWGFQALAYAFYSMAGWPGIFVLQSAITFFTFFFLYRNLRLLSPGNIYLPAVFLLPVFAVS